MAGDRAPWLSPCFHEGGIELADRNPPLLGAIAGRPACSSGVRRAMETAPPPPGKAAPVPRGSRKDEAAQGASRKRSASAPVIRKNGLHIALLKFYNYYVHYCSYANYVN